MGQADFERGPGKHPSIDAGPAAPHARGRRGCALAPAESLRRCASAIRTWSPARPGAFDPRHHGHRPGHPAAGARSAGGLRGPARRVLLRLPQAGTPESRPRRSSGRFATSIERGAPTRSPSRRPDRSRISSGGRPTTCTRRPSALSHRNSRRPCSSGSRGPVPSNRSPRRSAVLRRTPPAWWSPAPSLGSPWRCTPSDLHDSRARTVPHPGIRRSDRRRKVRRLGECPVEGDRGLRGARDAGAPREARETP